MRRVRRRLTGVIVLSALVIVVAGAAEAAREASLLPGQSDGGALFHPQPEHVYPSPSGWTTTPYTTAAVHRAPTPQVTILPCPSWAPTLVQHSDGTYECKADIPPDPGGPCLAAPGGPPYRCVASSTPSVRP